MVSARSRADNANDQEADEVGPRETTGGHSRRRVLAGVGAALSIGLAGCQGGGHGGGSGASGDGGGGDGGSAPSEPDGTGSSQVGGLAVAGLNSDIDPSEMPVGNAGWATEVYVENTGAKGTAAMDYEYSLTVTDGSGAEHSPGAGTLSVGGDDIAPGETTMLTLYIPEDRGPQEVASYRVTVECGTFSEGVYCDG